MVCLVSISFFSGFFIGNLYSSNEDKPEVEQSSINPLDNGRPYGKATVIPIDNGRPY